MAQPVLGSEGAAGLVADTKLPLVGVGRSQSIVQGHGKALQESLLRPLFLLLGNPFRFGLVRLEERSVCTQKGFSRSGFLGFVSKF